ncbi:hypothetical protein SAMN05216360_108220 [Methylobacterium phyllostachyos]|uniref:Uncharacterized protein n=1 Tax=Methylobacterium phyllostachyos TaxID=582672 RepID=A0A1H0BLM7_9HYPH|nr:hypothetical protein SAMN05216360_108220 [Methylobacterium phyllostachyos]
MSIAALMCASTQKIVRSAKPPKRLIFFSGQRTGEKIHTFRLSTPLTPLAFPLRPPI